jgi:hypothetical protein
LRDFKKKASTGGQRRPQIPISIDREAAKRNFCVELFGEETKAISSPELLNPPN